MREIAFARDRRRRAAGRRAFAIGAVSLGYGAVIAALVFWPGGRPSPVGQPPVILALIDSRQTRPDPDPGDAASPDKPAAAKAADRIAPHPAARALTTAPSSKSARVKPATARSAADDAPDSGAPAPGLSDAELAGAATVGPGSGASGGGACDMARRLQAALRKDGLVRAAVAGGGARPVLVWNGDWVQGPGEDGKGLAAVREAIMWEIGFSPAACKSGPVRGYVLLSLNDGPGAPRLVLGAHDWRWADLLK